MTTFVDNIRFVTVLCGECGVPFAMTEEFQARKLRDRTVFYCPSGHPRVYTGKTEAQKLQEQLDRERQVREAAESRALRMQGERAIAAYEENHGTPIDLSFAPDRAWIEGYVARQPLPPLDVEQMLKDCVPGGSSCDPQAIADEIRAWFARR